MHGLTRTAFFLSILAACGPGSDTTTAGDTTSLTTTTAPTTEPGTTTPTTGDPLTTGTTDSLTTSEPLTTSTTTTEPTTTSATTGDVVPCPDDGLPPAGSPCEPGTADCDPFADPCQPHASCEAGTWQLHDPDPADCPDVCDPFPQDGTPCAPEGASCNTGCEDQCQFCNLVQCSEGTWHNVEVVPAPCLDCDGICEATIQPMCAAGPPDKPACVAGCQDIKTGDCNTAYSAVLACAGFDPTFICDPEQRPLVAGCETQFDALYECLGI